MQLLECIKYYEDNQHSTSEDFFTFINGEDATHIHISAGSQNAVTLMTIHKSKGLEFPALLLPCLSFDTALAHEGSAASDIYCEDHTLSITRLKKVYGEHDEALRAALMRKQAKVYSDELNTLYVALTRPRNELYAYIMPKNCLRTLIPQQEHGSEHRYAAKEAPKSDSIEHSPAKYSDWVQLLQYEFMNSNDPRQHKARLRGTTVHYALSLVGRLTKNEGPKIISTAARAACARFPGIIEVKELETELNRIISAPKLSKFFSAQDAEVYCEKEFSTKSGAVLRVDRMLVGSQTVTIIDFKAAKVSGPAYAEQVRQYMQLAAELYPGKSVCGYLVYQDILDAEEVTI
jgi:ATP-dependent exoDNAse (exonuclease V) beta subunit